MMIASNSLNSWRFSTSFSHFARRFSHRVTPCEASWQGVGASEGVKNRMQVPPHIRRNIAKEAWDKMKTNTRRNMIIASLPLVARPGGPSSFLFLAPSSVLAPRMLPSVPPSLCYRQAGRASRRRNTIPRQEC